MIIDRQKPRAGSSYASYSHHSQRKTTSVSGWVILAIISAVITATAAYLLAG